ncbi:MAG: DUF2141 domain-containing protein [Thermoanaerobaculales bacterium]|jgi:uncharacterized protein (DUF2141 family)|nr:DUF2141 domain-containing protein [Thermoanaerobaculales bacterium]
MISSRSITQISLRTHAPSTFTLQRLGVVLVAVVFTACASAPATAPEPRPGGRGTVEITMTGFANEEGLALVAFFLDSEDWPDGGDSVFATEVVPISGGRAVAVIDDVPAGAFAVSVFHDTDGDRELDTGALGIPSEAYGFSADARSTFGPPKFDEARLELAAGETKHISIRVK